MGISNADLFREELIHAKKVISSGANTVIPQDTGEKWISYITIALSVGTIDLHFDDDVDTKHIGQIRAPGGVLHPRQTIKNQPVMATASGDIADGLVTVVYKRLGKSSSSSCSCSSSSSSSSCSSSSCSSSSCSSSCSSSSSSCSSSSCSCSSSSCSSSSCSSSSSFSSSSSCSSSCSSSSCSSSSCSSSSSS